MIENGVNPEALAVSLIYLSLWDPSTNAPQNVVKELRKQGQEAQLEAAAAAGSTRRR